MMRVCGVCIHNGHVCGIWSHCVWYVVCVWVEHVSCILYVWHVTCMYICGLHVCGVCVSFIRVWCVMAYDVYLVLVCVQCAWCSMVPTGIGHVWYLWCGLYLCMACVSVWCGVACAHSLCTSVHTHLRYDCERGLDGLSVESPLSLCRLWWRLEKTLKHTAQPTTVLPPIQPSHPHLFFSPPLFHSSWMKSPNFRKVCSEKSELEAGPSSSPMH